MIFDQLILFKLLILFLYKTNIITENVFDGFEFLHYSSLIVDDLIQLILCYLFEFADLIWVVDLESVTTGCS